MKDGGLAFPQPVEIMGRGMSLRDYFAAAALQAFLHPSHIENMPDVPPPEIAAKVAMAAYMHADAMLAERDKNGRP